MALNGVSRLHTQRQYTPIDCNMSSHSMKREWNQENREQRVQEEGEREKKNRIAATMRNTIIIELSKCEA